MAFRVSLGQYFPGSSVIHRLDPRAKLACSLVVMVSAFFVSTAAQLALALACSLALVAASRVPVARVLRSVSPVVAMLLALGVFNLLLTRGGETLVSAGPVLVTTRGVRAALLYPLRIVPAVVTMAVLLLTTTPTQITDAFEAALAPLSRLGLPGHELAMVFSLMLRFVPTLADEASAIVDAQTVRGAALGEGSPARRARAVGSVLVALLASSLHHAEGLSRALDARCYEGGAGRTHWHPLAYGRRDAVAALACAAYLVSLAALSVVALPGPLG